MDSSFGKRTRRWIPIPAVLVLLAFAASQPVTAEPPERAEAFAAARVSVDFGARSGDLLRTERLNNFGKSHQFAEQRRADVDFYNEQGLGADIQRVWISGDMCDVVAGTCDFESMDAYLRDAGDLADSLLLTVTGAPYGEPGNPAWMIRQGMGPEEIKKLVKQVVGTLKERYPKIEYIEAFNEPDMNLHGIDRRLGREPAIQPEELYDYYVPFYEAVNEINAELKPDVPLKIGGPTLVSLDHEEWMKAFLDGYAADPNPSKRLDFISYHGYGRFTPDFQTFHIYKSDPSEVGTQRERLEGWLKERGINKNIPAFVTETGIYPGPSFDDPDPSKTDYVRGAAGMASLAYWWARQPNTLPFNWVVRHGSEERKDQLITRAPDGTIPTETFSPYGNMLLMQSKMKTTKVEAVSDSLEAGQGVYSVASKDKTGASVMVWNYQHVNDNRFRVTIDMSRLPSTLRHGPVRQTMYRIDQDTSNYWTDTERANLQQVDEKIVDPWKTYEATVDLEPNGLYLVILEPV